MVCTRSKTLSPFVDLGVVCSSVSSNLRSIPRQQLHCVVTSAGSAVHCYNAQTRRLISVSDNVPGTITAVASDARYIYAAVSSKVAAFHLSRKPKYWFVNESEKDITLLLPFADHLIAVDESSRILVWEIETQELFIEIPFDANVFSISSIVHPNGYLNKVLLGSRQGDLRLYNLKTNKLIYAFEKRGSAILTLEQSPAQDVVAVGMGNGQIDVLHLKEDTVLFSFSNTSGSVLSLSFLQDKYPLLISGDETGTLSIWHLLRRKLLMTIPPSKAHSGPISGIFCLPNEPMFVSTSADNSLKTWIFDKGGKISGQTGFDPRLYGSLVGHSSPPSLVRFYGQSGELVLSTGALDSTVKLFSTVKLTKFYNLGTAGLISRKSAKKKRLPNYESLKLGPVTAIDFEFCRDIGWDNIACCHKDSPWVTCWTGRRLRLGDVPKLCHKRFLTTGSLREAVALAVAVSRCGNFVAIGYTSGHVDIFNIQSGIHRKSLVDPQLESSERAHREAVRGVVCDGLNAAYATGSGDGTVKFWTFSKGSLIETLDVTYGISIMVFHKNSRLVACALDDFSIIVIDCASRKLSRQFSQAHESRISALTFSNTGHWIYSGALDSMLKVWDLPSAKLIDVCPLNAPCTSMSISPNGTTLATTHTNMNGISLWRNRKRYCAGLTLAPLPDNFDPETAEEEESVASISMEVEPRSASKSTLGQIGSFLTLSGAPESYWGYILQLDVIKERNKPKEPPKKPKAAPFFLSKAVAGLDADTGAKETSHSKFHKALTFTSNSQLSRLMSESDMGNLDVASENILEIMKQWGPSKVDMELIALSPISGGSLSDLDGFLTVLLNCLERQRYFELCNSYLSVVIKRHREIIEENELLMQKLGKAEKCIKRDLEAMDILFDDVLSNIQHLKCSSL